MSRDMTAIVTRLETVATRLEKVTASSGVAAGDDEPEFVKQYGNFIQDHVLKYVELAKKIGDLPGEQATFVLEAYRAQHLFLAKVGNHKQPDTVTLEKLLKPTFDQILKIIEIKEKNRASKYFNHLATVSEAIGAISWVTRSQKPGNFIKDMIDSGQFYANRVIVEYKSTDETQVSFVKTWLAVIRNLRDYVMEFHSAGIIWNSQGSIVSNSAEGVAEVPPAPGCLTPISKAASSSVSADGDQAGLFAQLSKGANVTQGLRKVTDDMKTHKNAALRQGASDVKVSSSSKASPTTKTGINVNEVKKPVFELQGKRWRVEHQIGNKTISISDTNMKQTVYIFKCIDSTIEVKGKVNSIVIDSCKKVSMVLDDLLSGLEFVNCQSAKCQVMGKVPTISIDKTDGCLVYLSKESLNVEIITAKSSEMNILVPAGNDFTEHALPEQFKSTWNGKRFITVNTDINN